MLTVYFLYYEKSRNRIDTKTYFKVVRDVCPSVFEDEIAMYTRHIRITCLRGHSMQSEFPDNEIKLSVGLFDNDLPCFVARGNVVHGWVQN